MSSAISPAPTPPPLPPRADRRRKVPPLPPPSHPSAASSVAPKTVAPPAPNLTSPIVQAAQDVEHARRLLETPTVDDELDDADKEIHRMVREKEVTQLLLRMTDWVEELSSLLQNARKKEVEMEAKLTISQSNHQPVHINAELEESPKKLGANGSILELGGWRPWSKRDSRRTSDEESLNTTAEDTLTPLPKPQSPRNSGASFASLPNPSQSGLGSPTPSRFFNFSSLTRTSSSSVPSTPPLPEALPPPKPTQREKELEQQLTRERESLQKVVAEKTALEGELETLSQALFEQANKMVSNSNKKLAEIEEELRIAMEEREALKSTLRVIASHGRQSDGARDRLSVAISQPNEIHLLTDPSTPRGHSRSSSATSSLIFELPPTTPHPNQVTHDDDEEEPEDEDENEDVAHSQAHASSSDHGLNEEKEELELDTEGKQEPDGSISSQPEPNSESVPSHGEPGGEPKEESAPMDANRLEGDDVNTEEDPQLHNDNEQNPALIASEEADKEPVSSHIVPADVASSSSVSEYTLDSTH